MRFLPRFVGPAVLAAACAPPPEDAGGSGLAPWSPPAPDAGPALRGPGGPTASFSAEQLWQNCAPLFGGEEDVEHHNLVVPYGGHLVLPWAPEFGQGGLSFYDLSAPCEPVLVGEGFEQRMRETHSIGFVHLSTDAAPVGVAPGDYAVTNGTLGVVFWDISDPTQPESIHYLQMDNVFYPDAYARVVLAVAWQYPWVYAAVADNGIYVIDATDPAAPEHVATYAFDPIIRAGGVFPQGTELLVSSAEQSQAAILDISIPDQIQPIPGGVFSTTDSTGEAVEHYHGNRAGNLALFARKEGGGGALIHDISDPSKPTYVGDIQSDGNGGYVFYDEGFLFVGESSIARVYDARDLTQITLLGEGDLPGDLDTLTPYGNVAIISVDDEPEDDIASTVMPWSAEPDTAGPVVLSIVPADGATGVATTARVGAGFNEMIEPMSVHPGSLRLQAQDGTWVDGWGTGFENTANLSPRAPLQPGTTYTISVMAEGITDVNGNPVAATITSSFTTAGTR